MPNYSGNDSRFQVGFQTVWAPSTTPTVTLALEQKSNSLNSVQTMVESTALVGARTTHGVTPNNEKVEGSFSVEANPINIGPLAFWAMGHEDDVSEEVVDSVYEHTMKPVTGGSALPMLFGLLDKKVDVFGYESLKCDSFTLEQTPDDYLQASFDVKGRREIISDDTDTNLTMSSLSYTSVRPFVFQDLTLKSGTATGTPSTTMVDSKNFTLNYKNNLEDDRFVADGTPYMAEVDYTGGEFTVDIEVDYTTATNLMRENNKRPGVPMSLLASFQSSAEISDSGIPYTIEIEIPNAYITTFDPTIDGPERISTTVTFKATDDGTNPPVIIRTVDEIADKYITAYTG